MIKADKNRSVEDFFRKPTIFHFLLRGPERRDRLRRMNRPLRILSMITRMPVGGVERYICDVYPRLDPEKFTVRHLCIKERGELADTLEERGVPVDLIPTKSRLSPSGILAISRYMKKHKIDLVHTHMYRSNVPGTIAAKLAGVPLVVAHIHNVNTFETRRQLAMDKFLNRWRDAVICVSNSVLKDHVKHTGLGDDKALVQYNGTDTTRFGDTLLREPARKALGLAPDETAIFFTGRIANNKNPDIFIEIARRVVEPREKVRFMIVGDGPRREDVETSFKEAGLIGKTQFLGFRHDIPDLLQAADIAVLPSFKEGFSIAVIETLASGTPIVATDVGGTAEAVENGKSGVIVPPQDDEAFLVALEALVDDPARRQALSEGAVKRAQRFSLENTVSELESLYNRLSLKIAKK